MTAKASRSSAAVRPPDEGVMTTCHATTALTERAMRAKDDITAPTNDAEDAGLLVADDATTSAAFELFEADGRPVDVVKLSSTS
jgi:hypothetical protein